ncbi:hypothetical protein GCM10007108_16910 [Thermogymnomonas acidicola]|uniref:Uncharacterized protein n=1 Tax=Thermogymnomonas acidicola TaxID=399579 RepID=A0AA37FAC7_9ARCH|nr:hypothetical protein [Thermogymnomonas acidicola]GGM79299.1 hypothetical protein GCM10007108_16910 [Thermogymnomonas acidicola]
MDLTIRFEDPENACGIFSASVGPDNWPGTQVNCEDHRVVIKVEGISPVSIYSLAEEFLNLYDLVKETMEI